MTTTKNKGIYIWGSPKRGKTNTVYKRRTLWNATIQSNHSQKQNKTWFFCKFWCQLIICSVLRTTS
jgi:hypothetical protein